MRIFLMRIHAPRCLNYCLSNTNTFLFKKNPVICHVSVSVPIFSQHLESVLPMLTFMCSAFVSMGKHRIEENPSKEKTFTCLNHSVVILLRVMEWGRCSKSLREKNTDFNLIIIRLRAKYFGNSHEEISLGIFWVNIIVKFGQCADFGPPTLYGA